MAARKTKDQIAAENAAKAAEARNKKFNELRARARKAGVKMPEKADPFVIGADWGMDPEIEVGMPPLSVQAVLDEYVRAGNPFGIMSTLLSRVDYMRVMQVLDAEDDGDLLLVMLANDIIRHLYGTGIVQSEALGG